MLRMVSSTLGHTHTQPAAVPPSVGCDPLEWHWVPRGAGLCGCKHLHRTGPRGPIQCMCVPEIACGTEPQAEDIASGGRVGGGMVPFRDGLNISLYKLYLFCRAPHLGFGFCVFFDSH